MSDAARLTLGFAAAAALVLVLTPLAIRVAVRTAFLDHPAGYKMHARSTPYLGGVAVIAGFCTVAALGESFDGLPVILLAALALTALGTVDDRVGLGIPLRLAIQAIAALVLWVDDVHWSFTGVEALDLAVSVVWVVGVANAFNLLDNIDGAAASTATASAAGIAGLALVGDSVPAAAVAFALSGACLGFLPYNLASPSRIFLGDGGSLPIGCLLAALAMVAPVDSGVVGLLAVVPIVGVAVFDTTLVIVSRRRRGAPVLQGGRDHSTHLLLPRLGSARRVSGALFLAQGLAAAIVVAVAALVTGMG